MPHARPTCRFARLLPGVLALLAVPGASVSLDARPLPPEQAPVAASTSQTVDAVIAAPGRPAARPRTRPATRYASPPPCCCFPASAPATGWPT